MLISAAEITSVEGIISKVVEGLGYDQQARREEQPDLAEQIDAYILKLKSLLDVLEPFTLTVSYALISLNFFLFFEGLYFQEIVRKKLCSQFFFFFFFFFFWGTLFSRKS